jgi:hypothetical protein
MRNFNATKIGTSSSVVCSPQYETGEAVPVTAEPVERIAAGLGGEPRGEVVPLRREG